MQLIKYTCVYIYMYELNALHYRKHSNSQNSKPIP